MLMNPIIKTLSIDGRTPVQVYESLRSASIDSFLLESVKTNRKTGSYSIIAANPFLIFKSKGKKIEIITRDEHKVFSGNPIKYLQRLMKDFYQPPVAGYPPFLGGALGYISYDMAHFIERLPCTTLDDLKLPDCYFGLVDSAVVFDRLNDKIFLASCGQGETNLRLAGLKAKKNIQFMVDILSDLQGTDDTAESLPLEINNDWELGRKLESNLTQSEFENIVLAAKEYICAGDIFQVNLSQRLVSKVEGDYLSLYKRLRRINPSPFACYLELDGLSIAGCSPERLVRLSGNTVDTRPIAGTRPRGNDHIEDNALSAELILNEKERAEHIMLVDLERNDLGRICEYGSVAVDELMAIEDYSHVFHIVSNVQGRLTKGRDFSHVIKACFPGGTITGTPKIRSMEIIDELEPTRRGLYTGSVGYISFTGDMDLNIVIRSFVIKDAKAYIQAGCGIVADSVPEREYYETLYKAQALITALESNTTSI